MFGLPVTYVLVLGPSIPAAISRTSLRTYRVALNLLKSNQLQGVLAATLLSLVGLAVWITAFLLIRHPQAPAVAATTAVTVTPAIAIELFYLRFKDIGLDDEATAAGLPDARKLEGVSYRLGVAFPRLEGEEGCLYVRTPERDDVIKSLHDLPVAEARNVVIELKQQSRTARATAELERYIESSETAQGFLDAVIEPSEDLQHRRVPPSLGLPSWSDRDLAGIPRQTLPYDFVKRLLDIVIAVALLVLLNVIVPVIPATIIALRLHPERPRELPVVLKTWKRGRQGKPFAYFRFCVPTDESSWLSRFLTLTGCYKAPALFNVVKGEMSLVGPHPLSADYFERLTGAASVRPSEELQLRRLRVRPGLTGPSQIKALSSPLAGYRCEDYLERDAEYVVSRSLWGDITLLTQQAALAIAAIGRIPPADKFRELVFGP